MKCRGYQVKRRIRKHHLDGWHKKYQRAIQLIQEKPGSIIDLNSRKVVFDEFVLPPGKIVDYWAL